MELLTLVGQLRKKEIPDWLFTSPASWPQIAISTFLVFSLLVLCVRIAGLRSFAKMSCIDFASTIAIGSVLASTILNDKPSVVQGALTIALILGFQLLFTKLTNHFEALNRLLCNQPLLLMEGETILHENLKKVNLCESDLIAKLREANVLQLSEVKAVVFETTGDVSVLHGSDDKSLDDKLLAQVAHKG